MERQAFVILVALGGLNLSIAQDTPAKLDLSDPNLVFVDDAVIPIPLEIFASLDKLGLQDWGVQVAERSIKIDGNRSRMAMLFGLVVSEGFIAVQAQDKEGVRRIGRDVLRLAETLNVSPAVESHANAIIDGAGRGDWETVREELDKTRQTVLEVMKTNRDDELVALASIGGWLGGTDALASVLKQNYDPEGSDLLNQPDLVAQLRNDFNDLPVRARKGDLFSQVSNTLIVIESLMKTDKTGVISKGNVVEISIATSNLVSAIYES